LLVNGAIGEYQSRQTLVLLLTNMSGSNKGIDQFGDIGVISGWPATGNSIMGM
jgi:hypothetical protein